MATLIDTGKVTGRRVLHFDSIEDINADVELLAKAAEIRTLGNMSAGQIFKHLSTTMEKSIDGYSSQLPAPLRVVFRTFFKNSFLNKPMSAGFKLPKGAQFELVPGTTGVEEGLQSIRRAIKRLQTESHRAPSPVLGPLTRDEWNLMHCRHSELHMSFLIPVD
jgi:Protein of unknown function (DUF1569)